ncbi:hypothetical protein MJO28_008031, partial [Puccinia striiformis f. sp. tritici]
GIHQQLIYDGDSTFDMYESSLENALGTCVVLPSLESKKHTGNAILPGFDGVRLYAGHHTRRNVQYEDSVGLHVPSDDNESCQA